MSTTKVTDAMRDVTEVDAAKITTGTLPEARITSLAATKLTGTIADARISAGSVTQHVDLTAVRQDIAMLALYNAVSDNRAAYNLPYSFIDQFEDDTGTTTRTDVSNVDEYFASVYSVSGAFTSDSDTGFLLHSNTTNGSTTFTDSSSNTHTIGIQGTSPVHSTAKSKLGASSILLSGSNGLNVATHSSLVYAGNFTFEYWIWTANSGSGSRVVSIQQSHGNQMYTRHKSDSGSYGLVQVLMTGESNTAGEAYYSNNLTPEQSAISDWVHIAIVRQGAVIRGYIGGVQKVTWTKAAINTSPNGQLTIGYCPLCGPGEFVPANTYLDEIRFSGVCRYPDGTTFTPAEDNIATSATGTLISDTQTSSVATTKMSGVILYKDNAGTATTLGTDLVISLSANGGTNWTEAASYGPVTPLFSTGIKMVRLGETTVESGTAPVIKAVWANQVSTTLETQLHGWAMNY